MIAIEQRTPSGLVRIELDQEPDGDRILLTIGTTKPGVEGLNWFTVPLTKVNARSIGDGLLRLVELAA